MIYVRQIHCEIFGGLGDTYRNSLYDLSKKMHLPPRLRMAKQRLPLVPNRTISTTLSIPIPSPPSDNAPSMSKLADAFPKLFLRRTNNANTAYGRLSTLIKTPNVEPDMIWAAYEDFHPLLPSAPPRTRAGLHPPSRTPSLCTGLAKRSTADRRPVACYRALGEIDEPLSVRVSDAHNFARHTRDRPHSKVV